MEHDTTARLSSCFSSRRATSFVISTFTFAAETLSAFAGLMEYSAIFASPGTTWNVVIGSNVNAPVPAPSKSYSADTSCVTVYVSPPPMTAKAASSSLSTSMASCKEGLAPQRSCINVSSRLTFMPPNVTSLPSLVTVKDLVGMPASRTVPYFRILTDSEPVFVTDATTFAWSRDSTVLGADEENA